MPLNADVFTCCVVGSPILSVRMQMASETLLTNFWPRPCLLLLLLLLLLFMGDVFIHPFLFFLRLPLVLSDVSNALRYYSGGLSFYNRFLQT